MAEVNSYIAQQSDDAEEIVSTGVVLNGENGPQGTGDLDFVYESGSLPAGTEQMVGLRFTNLGIPEGATITDAYIEFTVHEPTLITISDCHFGRWTNVSRCLLERTLST